MKKVGIEVAVMSISSPGVCFQNEKFSRSLARRCNGFMAGTKRLRLGRFGEFAAVPLEYPEASFEEASVRQYEIAELEELPMLVKQADLTPWSGRFKITFRCLNPQLPALPVSNSPEVSSTQRQLAPGQCTSRQVFLFICNT